MRRWLAVLVLFLGCTKLSRVGFPDSQGFFRAAAPVDNPSFEAIESSDVLRAALAYPRPNRLLEAPVSLTASDGTGLLLTKLQANVVVEGPIAFTELRLSFKNHEDRVREGRFRVVLGPRAAVSRFAMRIGPDWQEGEVVERAEARRVYEDFLHARQDPALLETSSGNEFEARVFPIPANAEKDLIVSYSEELTSSRRPYRLALRGLPKLEQLEIVARVRQTKPVNGRDFEEVKLVRQGARPEQDFVLPVTNAPAAVRYEGLVAARVRAGGAGADAPLGALTILFDTSASRALDFSSDVQKLWALLGALRRSNDALQVDLIAFDQKPQRIFSGSIAKLSDAERQALLARRPLGASNLAAALELVRQHPSARVIVYGDGIATSGATEPQQLAQSLRRLAPQVRRLDMILSGGLRDQSLARLLVTGPLPESGVVLEADESPESLAARLGSKVLTEARVAVKGATEVFPETLRGLQPGDEALVFARLAPDALDQPKLRVELGATPPIDLASVRVLRPLIERAVARAQIEELVRRQSLSATPLDEAGRANLVGMAKAHRILTPYTALLVLESELDYEVFGIDREARSDVLVVGPSGVETEQVTGGPFSESESETEPVGRAYKGAPPRRTDYVGALPPSDEGYGYSFEDDPVASPRITARQSKSPSSHGTAKGRTVENEGLLLTSILPQSNIERRAPAIARKPSPAPSEPSVPAQSEFEGPSAHSGRFAEIARELAGARHESALVQALGWVAEKPGNVLALVALGQALEAQGERVLAARAYGSLIDLYPARADIRRFAAACLERLGPHGLALAVDSFQKARSDRPDHLTGHHAFALALLRSGRARDAFAALEQQLTSGSGLGRTRSGAQALVRMLELAAAAWLRTEPARRGEILDRLDAFGLALPRKPTLHFVLSWETDANDVDLHVVDADGRHAFFEKPWIESSGYLLEDVQNGYGPELFETDTDGGNAPFHLVVHYYARGPMGYGMGKVDVVAHDGDGNVEIDSRPFVVMNDGAYVDLGFVGKRGRGF